MTLAATTPSTARISIVAGDWSPHVSDIADSPKLVVDEDRLPRQGVKVRRRSAT